MSRNSPLLSGTCQDSPLPSQLIASSGSFPILLTQNGGQQMNTEVTIGCQGFSLLPAGAATGSSTAATGPERACRHDRPKVAILGTRGIPALHGGFETFAERLALHLGALGWDVEVYCQGVAPAAPHPGFERIGLVHIAVPFGGSLGSVLFDLAAMLRAVRTPDRLLLVLGYNTALFGILARLRGAVQIINMDGIEWRRAKWPLPVRAWFWCNERLACWLGDGLIADNPHIADHLATRADRSKISMIPYGADPVAGAGSDHLSRWALRPGGYALVIARPEPENSILEIVRAYSARARPCPLVVVGLRADGGSSRYRRDVLASAGPQVQFIGPVYDADTIGALRYHARLYLHGHQVGGTNPSLVEAMGAGCVILAHDNRFNRWVGGGALRYFAAEAELDLMLAAQLDDGNELCAAMRKATRERHAAVFRWSGILDQYTRLLQQAAPVRAPAAAPAVASAL